MALVVVQRGHVPRTTGATGAPGEQQFAIDTAAKLAPLLQAMGHSVRIINADVSLSEYRGDLFVAIHYDSGSSSASGASVGYQSAEGRWFAEAWKRAYVAAGWSRGFRPDNYTANLGGYYGVHNAIGQGNRAAIITESGFHSNAGDEALMSPERTARSIAVAVGEITGTAPKEEDWFDMRSDAEIKALFTEVLHDSWTHKHVKDIKAAVTTKLGSSSLTPRQTWTIAAGYKASFDALAVAIAEAGDVELTADRVKQIVEEALANAVVDVDINVRNETEETPA